MKKKFRLPRQHHLLTLGIASCLLAAAGMTGCASAVPARPSVSTPPPPAQVASAPAPTRPPAAPATQAAPTTPASASANRLAERIDAYISQSRFDPAQWAINIVSPETGRVLYAHNAGKLTTPASNTKLYTAALALSTLGSQYRIRTSLYATAAPRAGSIDGDLILYGRGDPTLGNGTDTQTPTGWADDFAQALADRGVTRIRGAIVADDTFFTGPIIPPGWEARDLQLTYSAPPSALTVEDNSFTLDVGPQNGLCCTVDTTPAKVGVDIVNLAQTDPSADARDLGIYMPPGSDQLYVYGAMRPHAKDRHLNLSVPDPARMAGELLLEALARQGIRVDGGVRTLHWPRSDDAIGAPGTVEIAHVDSPPLAEIVRQTLKHSNNLYAQLLLLQTGHRFEQQGGACPGRRRPPRTTLGWGICAMRGMIKRVGIDPRQVLIEEGSGLSHKDLVSPLATTTLLTWAAQQPFFAAYRNALPIAGIDGTLEWRMRHTAARGNLRAKTGTLRYTYTLSGYVTTASGTPLVFSLMLDDYARPTNASGHYTAPSPRHDLDVIAEMLADLGKPAADH